MPYRAIRWFRGSLPGRGMLVVLASMGVTGAIAAVLLGVSPAQPVPLSAPPLGSAVGADEEPITPIPQPPPADPLQVRLGERLFKDPRLSRGSVRSCSTCHDLRTNGASRSISDQALDGSPMAFNTSTVFNAALSFRLGWEGRYRTLEQQTASLIEGPGMGSSMKDVVAKLRADPAMQEQFMAAYGHGPDAASVTGAIATFERSLLTPGSRFDRWLEGDAKALTARELAGYHLFKSLGCIACHQGVNVGGNLFERHGIFHPLARPDPVLLRVPSLRNIAATPPYFHDGSAPTLQDAVRKMARAQLDDSLTDAQVQQIVAFLKTLSGEYRGRTIGASH